MVAHSLPTPSRKLESLEIESRWRRRTPVHNIRTHIHTFCVLLQCPLDTLLGLRDDICNLQLDMPRLHIFSCGSIALCTSYTRFTCDSIGPYAIHIRVSPANPQLHKHHRTGFTCEPTALHTHHNTHLVNMDCRCMALGIRV